MSGAFDLNSESEQTNTESKRADSERRVATIELAAGGTAALLASACCLGPLILVSLGLGGAWLSSLQALEPYRPYFIGAALVAMGFAYRRVFRPTAKCRPGELCALPRPQRRYKILFFIVSALVVVALSYPYLAPMFY